MLLIVFLTMDDRFAPSAPFLFRRKKEAIENANPSPTRSARGGPMQNSYSEIQSTRNPLAMQLKSLQRAKGRKEEGLFLAEGRKMVGEAFDAGMSPFAVLCSAKALQSGAPEGELLLRLPQQSIHLVSEAVLASVSDTVSPQPILAAFPLPKNPALAQQKGLCLLLDCLQDPGNAGSIMRSGDALGADWLLLGPGTADPYAPKTLRAAMGSTFHLPVLQVDELLPVMDKMKEQDYLFIAGDLKGEDTLPPSLPASTALVIGNEGRGISPEILANCQIRYRLPMKGRAESLNAAASAAILLYEISQRMPDACAGI